MGLCKQCPKLSVESASVDLSRNIEVLMWKKGVSSKLHKTGKQQEVFSIFKEGMTVAQAVALLKSDVKDLKKHIFVAYKQQDYARKTKEKLISMKSIHTVTLDESPTSAAFGGNALSLACFPVHNEFLLSGDGSVENETVCFIIDDMSHAFEQVEKMEARLMKIQNEKLGMEIR